MTSPRLLRRRRETRQAALGDSEAINGTSVVSGYWVNQLLQWIGLREHLQAKSMVSGEDVPD